MCIAKCLKEEEHKPEECSPEQIRECHGDVTGHPCIKGGEMIKNDA
ncbi:MAG: hypothetical protein KAV25_05535 [Methanophagales archaeon]|nr:hypothetical protein [Methanophagales archaeon]